MTKQALTEKAALLYTKAKQARPDKMTEQRLREQANRLLTKANK